LETLRDLQLTEAETKRVIDLMVQQADRMTSLVADLLTLAKLEGSPRPNGDQWTLVSRIFAQVEAEVRALSAGRHTIVFAGANDAQVSGAESELVSAVGNLVNNAVRYTADSGRIDVTWASAENGTGEIRVADTGRGVAREHLSRLTERFYRVDGSRSRDSGGTGLGLAIVKHVTQRHGGELDIASEVGKGSTFRLLLPAARVRNGPTVARRAAEAADHGHVVAHS
jgi:two-component system phosphate regulon sensor histidine kinase PhoR